ncbi:hypothetical protein [Candidatus Electronema sp. JC]|uniref:hypothetical protein n=1 Tax=Candidatus Electronema sp. JC TaxID=3401570 RepID=UPI003B427CCC
MNIFTAAVTGLTIVIKKIGIGFKAVMTGLKIAIISVINFIASVITAIFNAIVSAIKWVVTQIVNLINWLFRTYLRLEAGCVPPVQKFVGLMIRLRWGFVILSGLYAVYQYFGITALLVAIAVCVVLVVIGYSEAEKEEEEWNVTLDKFNKIIATYLKYLIRLGIMIFSVCSLHAIFNNKILTISAAIVSIAVIFYAILSDKKEDEKVIGFIKRNNDTPLSEKRQGIDIVSLLYTIFWLVWAVLFLIGVTSYYKQI